MHTIISRLLYWLHIIVSFSLGIYGNENFWRGIAHRIQYNEDSAPLAAVMARNWNASGYGIHSVIKPRLYDEPTEAKRLRDEDQGRDRERGRNRERDQDKEQDEFANFRPRRLEEPQRIGMDSSGSDGFAPLPASESAQGSIANAGTGQDSDNNDNLYSRQKASNYVKLDETRGEDEKAIGPAYERYKAHLRAQQNQGSSYTNGQESGRFSGGRARDFRFPNGEYGNGYPQQPQRFNGYSGGYGIAGGNGPMEPYYPQPMERFRPNAIPSTAEYGPTSGGCAFAGAQPRRACGGCAGSCGCGCGTPPGPLFPTPPPPLLPPLPAPQPLLPPLVPTAPQCTCQPPPPPRLCPPPALCPPPLPPPPCPKPLPPLPCPAPLPPPPCICPPALPPPQPLFPPPLQPIQCPTLPPQPFIPQNDCCCNCQRPCRNIRFRRYSLHGSKLKSLEEEKRGPAMNPKCNSVQLEHVILENISSDLESSKRRIQSGAEAEMRRAFNTICGTGEFSFIVHARLYCQASAGPITCYAFSFA